MKGKIKMEPAKSPLEVGPFMRLSQKSNFEVILSLSMNLFVRKTDVSPPLNMTYL